jgi:hypothetical protein
MVTLSIGQAVTWPPAPSGIAQIVDLRRTRVRIVYRTKHGRTRYANPRVRDLTIAPLLFEMHNPFDRGIYPRIKTYEV